MRPETAVLDVQGPYRVYTEFYRSSPSASTVILVNGSLATTASFAQTVRNLTPRLNVVLYDQPYAGKSREHNGHQHLISKAEESRILLDLIEHFHASHVMSFSWGGACAMQALAQRPRRIKSAVVNSFSPIINPPMRDYLDRGCQALADRNRQQIATLINATIGKHLPPLFKRFNHRHVSSLAEQEYAQTHHHVKEVLHDDLGATLTAARDIDVPVLFVNGEWDEYTTPEDARAFGGHVRDAQFVSIAQAGHFLDMEHKAACEGHRRVLLGFFEDRGEIREWEAVRAVAV